MDVGSQSENNPALHIEAPLKQCCENNHFCKDKTYNEMKNKEEEEGKSTVHCMLVSVHV